MLGESPLNLSYGYPDGSNYGPLGGAFFGDSLEGINYGSFRSILGGSNDVPPWGALIGASLEYSGCGADSWGLFEAFLKLDLE